jgi:outer membrane protein assembly factor BamB
MMRKQLSAGVFVVGLGFATLVHGADWANWRGPAYNGSTDETGLPVEFTATEGVKWVVEMPGPSAGTPIVSGDRVFVSSTDFKGMKLLALCYDRKTGKQLWSYDAGSGYQAGGAGDKLRIDDRSNYASPSPVTDGKTVVFTYGNGDLLALDLEGKLIWSRNIQKEYGDFAYQWTFSATPTLYGGKLYYPLLQRNQVTNGRGKDGAESFILALDPATGKELYKHVRETKAMTESRESYGTIIPYEGSGRKELVIAGGDILTGHDPQTGKELWRWGTWNPGYREQWWRLVATPTIGGGVAIIPPPKGNAVYAVKLGGNGDLGDAGLAWKSDQKVVTSDVASALFYKDKFYVLSDLKHNLSAVNPADGKTLWTTPIPGPVCWGSPTGADGKVYVLSTHGEVTIYNADDGKLLHKTQLGGEDEQSVRSSIAVSRGNLFIRTEAKLFCIGK